VTVNNGLPVAIIGAGPVGLAAAAQLLERGESPIVLETGETIAASVLSWGHVPLFSPWEFCIDGAAKRLLEKHGWQAPNPSTYPTGKDLYDQYLQPLAKTPEIAPLIRTNSRVISVARLGLDKMKNEGRDTAPFILNVVDRAGKVTSILARAIIDASGTYTSPNPLGSSGVPAPGERDAHAYTVYRIPDVNGADRFRYVGKQVAVVGSGHSAFNALIELAELKQIEPRTRITWIVRKPDVTASYGGESGDALPERGALGSRVKILVESNQVQLEQGFRIATLETHSDKVTLTSEQGRKVEADQIVATTGFRPDLTILSELRLNLHPAVESPVLLADMIDPNFHSCGTVEPHGVVELSHPEKDLYIVGMKSYGRAPTFLMMTGYEQVRSIACELTGDHEGARKVELVLPETGVCSGDGCCLPPPTRKTIKAGQRLVLSQAKPDSCEPGSGCC